MTGSAVAAVVCSVDGTPIAPTVHVLTVRVSARFGAPAQCEVTLYDPAGYGAWPAPAVLGTRFAVQVTGEAPVLFDGQVTCVELTRAPDGTTTTRVRAYDVLHRLRKRQTLRVMEGVTATAVARTLTGGLGVDVDGPMGPSLARVIQHRQSDFDLLMEVAARSGLLVTLDGDTLRLTTLDGYGDAVALHFGESLFEASVEANVDRVAQSVTALGWDTETATQMRVQASTPRSGRKIAMTVPDDGEVSLVEQPGSAVDDVGAAAQLALDLRAAHAVVLRGVAAGDARMRPGSPVTVTGIGESVDGRYVLCEVVHVIDGRGYQTTFSTEPPPAAAPERGAAITLGLVTAVDDASGRGRVRVSLPAMGDLDAGWLGVVCPGAGRGKGLVALPDVGDTVAVALPHAEPTAGLVLGSLYGALTPPDPGVTGSAVRRWSLRTADGQSIVLDDAAHSVRVENHDGSFLELAPGEVVLQAKTDLVLDAAGHAITIRASSIDFQHAAV